MTKFIVWIIVLVSALYIGLVILVFAAQRSLLFIPPKNYLTPPDVNVQMAEIKNAEGDIVAWWSPPATETSKTVMVFHGNGSAIYSNHHIFRDLIAEGHGVLSLGYPGYPGRGGKTTQAALTDAAIEQYEWIRAKGIPAENIVYYGTSLGTGVAAQLSMRYEPVLLFVDAPFDSGVSVAKTVIKFLPIGMLMKDKFRSDLALRGKSIPLIWTHGTNDKVVPLFLGQRLYDGYKGPKTAHIIQGGEHTDLWLRGGREITLAALRPKTVEE